MTGLSIRPDGTRNGAVFLISRPDQRNGSRAFIPSVCCLLHSHVGTGFDPEAVPRIGPWQHVLSVERPFAIQRCILRDGHWAITNGTGLPHCIQRFR